MNAVAMQNYHARKQVVAQFKVDQAKRNPKVYQVSLADKLILSSSSGMVVAKANETLHLLASDYRTITVGINGFKVTLPIDSKKVISIN